MCKPNSDAGRQREILRDSEYFARRECDRIRPEPPDFPRTLAIFGASGDPARYRARSFRLERSFMEWFAAIGFHSKWMTRIVHGSRLSGPIHNFIRRSRKECVPIDCHDCDIRPRSDDGSAETF